MIRPCTISLFLFFSVSINLVLAQQISVIPLPKDVHLVQDKICLDDLFFYTEDPQLEDLFEVLEQELKIITYKGFQRTRNKNTSSLIAQIDKSLAENEYKIEIQEKIKISGGSYNAVAMGSISLLQLLEQDQNSLCWQRGIILDSPKFNFRGLLIDLARRPHDIATIKRVILLCRWYKINYLQLHLTDEHAFTFPSLHYPQLSTPGWTYSREELEDLVAFADKRGVEIIPELEVPGHAGQLVQKMPEVFGFDNKKIHPFTIHMGRERVYGVLDTLIGEIAEIFHSSEYIHIGGDEANFSNMEADPEIKKFLEENKLENIEELYWHFLNKMNTSVKKRSKKTIVWEGFSKEGNAVVDKDIVVMAWESLYQLPQDILAAGYRTVNVSWKPLYVVNQRKWNPETIYNWNIFRWENWVPSIPSYDPIQLEPHPGIIGTAMASWDQPAYTEISSLRLRLPAMAEEAWNHSRKLPFEDFNKRLQILDNKFDNYLSPVEIKVNGLSYPDIIDGHRDEQTWFDDEVRIELSSTREIDIRITIDGSPVTRYSPEYTKPIVLENSTELRYCAFKNEKPIGAEILEYFELHPLKVEITGDLNISLDEPGDTTEPHLVKFDNQLKVEISSKRKGEIKYALQEEVLDSYSRIYISPLQIQERTTVKAGLFVDGNLVGEPWIRHFEKQKKN